MSSRQPTSPPSTSSRSPSMRPGILQHAPTTPSALREAHTFSGSPDGSDSSPSESSGGQHTAPGPSHHDTEPAADDALGLTGTSRHAASETTSLLRRPVEIVSGPAHAGPCNHGTFSPTFESPEGSVRSFGGDPPRSDGEAGRAGGRGRGRGGAFSSLLANVGMTDAGGSKQASTTSWLAERHGITNTTSMYVAAVSSCRELKRESRRRESRKREN